MTTLSPACSETVLPLLFAVRFTVRAAAGDADSAKTTVMATTRRSTAGQLRRGPTTNIQLRPGPRLRNSAAMTRRAITILSVLAALGATSIGVGTAAAKHGADDAAGH